MDELINYVSHRSNKLDHMLRAVGMGKEVSKQLNHTLVHLIVEEPDYSFLPKQISQSEDTKKQRDSKSDISSLPPSTYFTEFVLDFASSVIADRITEKFEELYGENATSYYGPLQRRLLESLFHKNIGFGGVFNIKDIKGDVKSVTLPESLTLQCRKVEELKNLQLKSPCYCRPQSSTFKTINSLLVSKNILFQITKAQTHSFDLNVVEQIRIALKAKHVDFYWVVPPYRFADFKLNPDRESTKCHQYVFEFNFQKRKKNTRKRNADDSSQCGYNGCVNAPCPGAQRCKEHKGKKLKKTLKK